MTASMRLYSFISLSLVSLLSAFCWQQFWCILSAKKIIQSGQPVMISCATGATAASSPYGSGRLQGKSRVLNIFLSVFPFYFTSMHAYQFYCRWHIALSTKLREVFTILIQGPSVSNLLVSDTFVDKFPTFSVRESEYCETSAKFC